MTGIIDPHPACCIFPMLRAVHVSDANTQSPETVAIMQAIIGRRSSFEFTPSALREWSHGGPRRKDVWKTPTLIRLTSVESNLVE